MKVKDVQRARSRFSQSRQELEAYRTLYLQHAWKGMPHRTIDDVMIIVRYMSRNSFYSPATATSLVCRSVMSRWWRMSPEYVHRSVAARDRWFMKQGWSWNMKAVRRKA